jgi:hypothetical protein
MSVNCLCVSASETGCGVMSVAAGGGRAARCRGETLAMIALPWGTKDSEPPR